MGANETIPSRAFREKRERNAKLRPRQKRNDLLLVSVLLLLAAAAELRQLFLVFGAHGCSLFLIELAVLVLVILLDEGLPFCLLFVRQFIRAASREDERAANGQCDCYCSKHNVL